MFRVFSNRLRSRGEVLSGVFDLFSTRCHIRYVFSDLIFDDENNVSFYSFSIDDSSSLLSLSLSDDANDCSVSAAVSVLLLFFRQVVF